MRRGRMSVLGGGGAYLTFENDHSKLPILVYSRQENQRIWPLVVTATIPVVRQLKFLYEGTGRDGVDAGILAQTPCKAMVKW